MNGYSKGPTKTETTSGVSDHLTSTHPPPLQLDEEEEEENPFQLPHDISHSQLTSSDSASSLSMSSGYERRVMTSFRDIGGAKDPFDLVLPMSKGDCGGGGLLSPNGSSGSDSAVSLNERVRSLESEKLTLMVDHNTLIKDFNKRMQSYLDEIRTLKEVNANAEQDVAEMRDLCCFLDDDRRKCRKLAKEWQKFGRNTVTTLKSEVAMYQQQISQLESKNTELVQENFELRELCLHLDTQAANGQLADAEFKFTCQQCTAANNDNNNNSINMKQINNNTDSAKVSLLETQVEQLEREKDMLHRLLAYGGNSGSNKNTFEKKRVSFNFPNDDGCDSSSTASELDFPPTALNMDLLSKPSTVLHENVVNGMSSLNINSSSSREKLNNSMNSSREQLMIGGMNSSREQLMNGGSGSSLDQNWRTGGGGKLGGAPEHLPAYEDSVRYLESSRNNSRNNSLTTGRNVVASESDVL